METWIIITITLVFPLVTTCLVVWFTLKSKLAVTKRDKIIADKVKTIDLMSDLIEGQEEVLNLYR